MKNITFAAEKIHSLSEMQHIIRGWRLKGKSVAFTNGCFDVLHAGHLLSINEAAQNADYLIIAINSDESIAKIKGTGRPINNENDRALLLSNFTVVDAVVIFGEETPLVTIKALLPDVLVKGGDYTLDQVVGATEVQQNGGKVIINPILKGYSSTATLEKMRAKNT